MCGRKHSYGVKPSRMWWMLEERCSDALLEWVGERESEKGSKPFEIVGPLMERAKVGPVVLRVQSDIVDEGMSLDQTAAGRVLGGEVAEAASIDYETQPQEARREFKAEAELEAQRRRQQRTELEAKQRKQQESWSGHAPRKQENCGSMRE